MVGMKIGLKGGEKIDNSYLATQRVAGTIAQALPQESVEKWSLEHGAPEAVVCFKKRTAPYPEKEGHPAA